MDFAPLRDQFFYLHSAILQSAAAILALSVTILLSLDQRRKDKVFRLEQDLVRSFSWFHTNQIEQNIEELNKFIPKWQAELSNPKHLSKGKIEANITLASEYIHYSKASYLQKMNWPLWSLVMTICISTVCLLFPTIQYAHNVGFLINAIVVCVFLYSVVSIAFQFLRIVKTEKK